MNQIFQEKEYTSNLDPKLWLAVLKQALPYKKLLIAISIQMILMAGMDSMLPLFTRYAIDHMIIPKDLSHLLPFALLYLALLFVGFINVTLFIHFTGKVETGMNYDLRRKCFHKLQAMQVSYYDRTPTGWLVARITSDISRLGDIVAWGIVDMAWGIGMVIFVLAITMFMDWKLSLLMLAMIPIMTYIGIIFQKRMLKVYRRVRKLNSKITHSFGEGIHGAKTTKTLVREDAHLAEFKEINNDMYRSSVKAAVLSALFMPLILMLSSTGLGLILWLGGVTTLKQGMTVGALMAFIEYITHMFEPISNVARLFAEMQNGQAAAERVFTLIDLEPEIISTVPWDDNWAQKPMHGRISIQDLTFAYKEGANVFKHFNLEIAPGESIALVGETGTGKTTLVNLICRFYEPVSGTISIDGIDYRELPLPWIHRQLGYVQQIPHLFQGSIRENIRYGRLEASDKEVYEAARVVFADDFIQRLPGAYDYLVGEAGNLLSTGQKQLIAFARVVLANPRLLILDEATASIDTETEGLVQQAMHQVLANRTGIIVAHRLSTIRSVDRILLMHLGKVLEEGSHHQLMQRKGLYYKLYMNQFMQETADQELAKDA